MTLMATPPVSPAGQYEAASDLDRALGDPRDPANRFSFAAMRARDEAGRFPAELAAAVGPALRLSFVPAELGGDLSTMDETLALVRIAARRDLTVMPATMFSITAATCVLLAGTAEQRAKVVRLLRAGEAIGFALSEPEHGSDLLANTCRLEEDGEGWRLSGDKWLVGLGKRCAGMLVIANSGGRGPGAFTAVLLDRDRLAAGEVPSTQRPAGMRGIDFAGFRFDGLPVSGQSTVGSRGRGLETAMKAMQVVRTMSTGANLACADTGLRLTMDFARRHRLAGKPLIETPHARRELGTAAAALIACDVAAVSCARAMHALPASQSLWSSVVKKVLTELSEEVFARCADVLGTRSQLADGPEAAFETARRDNAVVRYIDTGPVANLRLVTMQLGQLAAKSGQDLAPTNELTATFTLDAPLPPLRLDSLELSVRGRDEVTQTPAAFDTPGSYVARELAELYEQARRADPGEAIDLAERFCYLHTAAACRHLWWANRHLPLFGAAPGSTGWLTAVLSLLRDRAHGRVARLSSEHAENTLEVVDELHEDGRLFSAIALPLAESAGNQEGMHR